MTYFICATCGVQHAASDAPPPVCAICADERQYVGWGGQLWTTLDALRETHRLSIQDDCGVLSIAMTPGFGINQRAMFLPTSAGNILWESLSVVTDDAVQALKARGGIDMIAISHPHFYSSMVEWSEAFGGVPIFVHANDRAWVKRSSAHVRFWDGETLKLSEDVRLVLTGGHFAGSAVLHWAKGPRGGGALFPGDAPHVVMDRRHATFMYSNPNAIPMRPHDVETIRTRLHGLSFEDVFGFATGRNIIGGGRRAIDRSFERYLRAVGAL